MGSTTGLQDPWIRVLDQSGRSAGTGPGLDPDERRRLESLRLQHVYISPDRGSWEIYFHSPLGTAPEDERRVREIWNDAFGPEVQGEFYFIRPESAGDLASVCSREKEKVLARLAESLPSAAAWLEGADWQARGNRLTLCLRVEMGLAYAKTQNAGAFVEAIFKVHYGLEVSVDFALLEEKEDARTPLDRLNEKEDLSLRDFTADLARSAAARPKEASHVVLGRKIESRAKGQGPAVSKTTPLSGITEEEKSVLARGLIFDMEDVRQSKNGTWILSFSITDYTDSIVCKCFISQEKNPNFDMTRIAKGEWYLFRGPVRYDSYSKELTLYPNDITRVEAPKRLDQAAEKRVELHLHTKMSFMDAMDTAETLVSQAAEWGHEAVAITDHGVVQAFPEAMAAAKGRVKVIYGVEGYLCDLAENGKEAATYHIVILAKNQVGLLNLYKLISLSHLDHFKRTPRIPRTLLNQHREGLILGSACEAGELFQKILRGGSPEEIDRTAAFYDYLEIQPRGNNMFMVRKGILPDEQAVLELNRQIFQLGKRLGVPVAATGDVHFLNPEGEIYRRILMAGKGFEDADQQAPLYFKTTEEMLEEFAYLGEAEAYEAVVGNTRLIAGWMEPIQPVPDEFAPPVIPGSDEEIRDMAFRKAGELYGDPLPRIIQDRLDQEMRSIISHGYTVLYLIAHRLVKKSNEDGYLVGSRGSVGSSLAAYLCQITEVNPMPPHYRCPRCRHTEFHGDHAFACGADMPAKSCPECGEALIKDGFDIPFEVFLGFKGEKIPDIDLNFSGEYQGRAHKYTEDLFGKDHVFRAGTIATVADKTAYGFVKNYFEERKLPVRNAEINRLVQGCTGVKRTTGQHPGGIIVLPKNREIYTYTPIQHPADDTESGVVTTHFDYHAIDNCLVKLDLLGHDDPTVIKMLEDMTGIDAGSIPLDDPNVLSLFRGPEALGLDRKQSGLETGTLGVPEFGTKFVRQMLEDTEPASFADLVRISGFSHGTNVWLGNAQTLLKSGAASMNEVIAARDDIMIYLIQMGVDQELAFTIMEKVRKGKGVAGKDAEAMRACRVPEWYIESCQKIKYLFPKAHAVAYVTMAFRIAWFKVYHPAAFYAGQFSCRADEVDADLAAGGLDQVEAVIRELERKIANRDYTAKDEKTLSSLELVREMYLRGIDFKPVDLEKSLAWHFFVEPGNRSLRLPLASVQGLGLVVAQNIVSARERRPFFSVEDLKRQTKASKTVIEALRKHGALEGMSECDQQVLFS